MMATLRKLESVTRLGLVLTGALIGAGPMAGRGEKPSVYPVQLNGELAFLGEVLEARFSPVGDRIVYRADQQTDEAAELFSVPTGGGEWAKLSGDLVAGGKVSKFLISADGTRVVYLATQDDSRRDELYSVPITGGEPPAKLNALLRQAPANASVSDDFLIAPDSRTVFYRAHHEGEDGIDLWAVPIEGGVPVLVNEDIPIGSGVNHFTISADGSWLAYRGHSTVHSVPLTGGAPIFLASTTDNSGLLIAPDNSHVLYDEGRRYRSIPIAGGESQLVTRGLEVDTAVLSKHFEISPNSSRVAYLATDSGIFGGGDLFSAPISGGDPTKLNLDGVPVFEFAFTSGGQHVVFLARQNGRVQLFKVLSEGGAPVPLDGAAILAGDVDDGIVVAPDALSVYCRASATPSGVCELYNVAMTGGQVTKLSGPLPPESAVGAFVLSAASGAVVYRTSGYPSAPEQVFRVSTAGGPVAELTAGSIAGGRIRWFSISPDGSRVAYIADQDVLARWELFSVRSTGESVKKLNGPLAAGGPLRIAYETSPDGKWVVYTCDQDTAGLRELYSIPTFGGTAVKLNGPLVRGGTALMHQVSADSSRVVYSAPRATENVVELYVVSIGGGAPLKLNPPLSAGGDVLGFELSPDGSRVVYRADQEANAFVELFSVGVAGGDVTKLNDAFPTWADVHSFAITPDSATVVYRATKEAAGVLHLYSVPTVGGEPTRLSPDLPGVGVTDFVIVPGGEHVLYGADVDEDGVAEAYSVPLHGGPVADLRFSLEVSERIGSRLEFAPDGSSVVYREDVFSNGSSDLFSVPVTGGMAVKLSGPFIEVGSVTRAEVGGSIRICSISADSKMVVYMVYQGTEPQFELYSVPLTGGVSTKLNGELTDGGRPLRYEISPDGSEVAYVADQDTDEMRELYRVPIEGGVPEKISPPLAPEQDVWTQIRFSDNSRFVIFRVEDDTAGIYRLYMAPRSGGPPILVDGALGGSASQAGLPALGPLDNWVIYPAARAGDGIHNIYVGKPQAVWEQQSGAWSDAENWRWEAVPGPLVETIIANGGECLVPAGQTVVSGSLVLGGETDRSVLELDSGATLRVDEGAVLLPAGVFSVGWGGELGTRLSIGRHLLLGGTLRLRLASGFLPAAEESLDVWSADSVSGRFDHLELSPLSTGFAWDASDVETTGELKVLPVATQDYTEFAAASTLTTSPDEDEEGDGWANLFEYLGGRDPHESDAGEAVLAVGRSGQDTCITFDLAQSVAPDVRIEVESSTTLRDSGPGGWEVIASRDGSGPWAGPADVYLSPQGEGIDRVSVKTLSAPDPQRFYRLRVGLLP